MHIQFSKNNWSLEDLTYAYSFRFPETPVFTQKTDHICNRNVISSAGKHENIPLVTKAKYKPGVTVSTRCSFEHYGAPLVLLVKELETDTDGILRFGNYLEVVLYENGINVWHMWKEDKTVRWKWLLAESFPVSAGDIHTLSVHVKNNLLEMNVDDRTASVAIPELTDFHVGITACEGICSFYDMTVSP